MSLIRKSAFIAVATTVISLTAAGCQSTGRSSMADTPSTQAVRCSKCETTWVRVPRDNGQGHIVGYTDRKKMVCPDCKDEVANFFTTGKFQHTCKTCGDSMELCEGH